MYNQFLLFKMYFNKSWLIDQIIKNYLFDAWSIYQADPM